MPNSMIWNATLSPNFSNSMVKQSAGLLVFRRLGETVELLLVHPGGPIFGHQDKWSIPKGELDDGENHLAAAFREFSEEVGIRHYQPSKRYSFNSC